VHDLNVVLPESMRGGWVARLSRSGLELVGDEESDAKIADVGVSRIIFGGMLTNGAEVTTGLDVEASSNGADAEVLLQAYRRAGESILPSLRGTFAFVLLDPDEETGLCVRDPLGTYPLFTADLGGDLLVSPSIESLLAHGASREVNVPAVADHLLHRWPDPAETYFRSIHRVPPGHALRMSPSGQRLFRYWEPLPLEGPIDWIGEDELHSFDDLLDRAVVTRLDTGPAGIFLSGGLDSVSVAAVAAATAGERGLPVPQALSIVFPEPDVNESDVQSGVAASLGLPQVLLSWDRAVGGQGIVQDSLDLTGRSPSPLINFWAPAYDRLALQGTSRGCKVILTGAGGDEWLGVSPLYAADLVRSFDVAGLYRLIAAQRRSYHLSDVSFVRNALWRFGARPLVVESLNRTAHGTLRRYKMKRALGSIPSWIAPGTQLRNALVERALGSDPLFAHTGRRPRDRPSFYLDAIRRSLDHALVSVEMEETFEQGRRVGVSIRAPYWDAELLEFLCRTPPALLNRGGRAKGLVRAAVASRFPSLGFKQQRKVSSLRFATSIFSSELPGAWASLGGPRLLAEAGIVDRKGVQSLVEASLAPGAGSRSVQTIWDILNLEVWLRSHF
jgi:asparagine synthase (glutamine-hydrolysing)